MPDLIEAAVGGDEVLIAKDEQHIVRLVPVSGAKPVPQFGSAKGLITMAEDFDAPLELTTSIETILVPLGTKYL